MHQYWPGSALGALRGIDSKAYNFLTRVHVGSVSRAGAGEVFLPAVIKCVFDMFDTIYKIKRPVLIMYATTLSVRTSPSKHYSPS